MTFSLPDSLCMCTGRQGPAIKSTFETLVDDTKFKKIDANGKVQLALQKNSIERNRGQR
jgi:hypothetical protein